MTGVKGQRWRSEVESQESGSRWRYLLPPVVRAQKVLVATPQEAAQLQLLEDPLLGTEQAQQTPPAPRPALTPSPASHRGQLAQATWPQGGDGLPVRVCGVGGQWGPVPMAEHLGRALGQGRPGGARGRAEPGWGHLTTATNTRGPSGRAWGRSSSKNGRGPAGWPRNPGPAMAKQPDAELSHRLCQGPTCSLPPSIPEGRPQLASPGPAPPGPPPASD